MTDAYDELRRDWCDEGDMPRATCHHCGAHPGGPALPPPDRPWTFDGQRMTRRSGRDVFPSLPTPPADETTSVKRKHRSTAGTCACGQDTRDNAYACDHCAGELERLFAEAPWVAEQLDATITRQRAAGAAGGGSDPESLPWNDKAAGILNAYHRHFVELVRYCAKHHVRHQSPYVGVPSLKSIPAMSAWLLWRVDGLTLDQHFTASLKDGLKIERDALFAIDCGPDLMYLGLCDRRDDDGLCGGAIYARAGEPTGKCRACRAEYQVETQRSGLEKALDDRLCTAAEIAHLATYLGISAPRHRVSNLVTQWNKRGRIAAKSHNDDGDPQYRYGDVLPLLAQTYPDDSKGA